MGRIGTMRKMGHLHFSFPSSAFSVLVFLTTESASPVYTAQALGHKFSADGTARALLSRLHEERTSDVVSNDFLSTEIPATLTSRDRFPPECRSPPSPPGTRVRSPPSPQSSETEESPASLLELRHASGPPEQQEHGGKEHNVLERKKHQFEPHPVPKDLDKDCAKMKSIPGELWSPAKLAELNTLRTCAKEANVALMTVRGCVVDHEAGVVGGGRIP